VNGWSGGAAAPRPGRLELAAMTAKPALVDARGVRRLIRWPLAAMLPVEPLEFFLAQARLLADGTENPTPARDARPLLVNADFAALGPMLPVVVIGARNAVPAVSLNNANQVLRRQDRQAPTGLAQPISARWRSGAGGSCDRACVADASWW
jgi:hypothetical protein